MDGYGWVVIHALNPAMRRQLAISSHFDPDLLSGFLGVAANFNYNPSSDVKDAGSN
ncbi:hypothetical protein M5D96_004533 [Drosophila gunungcola]|uniref:Uncharacterized protein n=1 Tax=Drosophila gunungcola TaxID=103775 RepID=A0A9Q0BT51_9MUSC|nr:hypothetical protein M5D96_004533 [Drosophila gunungcola]